MMRSFRTIFLVGFITISLLLLHPIPAHANLNQSELAPTYSSDASPRLAQDIGDAKSFWAIDFDAEAYYQLDAQLLAIGDYCYIYFEDTVIGIIGEAESNNRANLYMEEFDTNIYSRVTDLAGDPDGTLGDVDGDPRVIILIMENLMSCYLQSNEIEGPYSNMCEMVYLCYLAPEMLNDIAHEFHHLVWFNNEFDEVHFILEGVAEYAAYFSGYLSNDNISSRTRYFLNDPHDSLIYFDVESQDYGAGYLFAFYLAEQYGVQFLRDLVKHESDGALGLETALEEAGHNISFNELYLDWMTALTIDEQGFADDRYCLRGMDVTFQGHTTIDSLPYRADSVSLYCYGSEVYQIATPPDRFCIEMSQPNDEVAGLSVAYRDIGGWHVQQVQKRGRAVMSISGESIDAAYLVASFLYNQTPAGNIDFGSGYQSSVQILVYEGGSTTTSSPAGSPDILPEVLTFGVVALVIVGIIAAVRYVRE